jgi:hypothetical protein
MSNKRSLPLRLEVLNGPLDGAALVLDKETVWSRTGLGPLVFPWDEELGDPQAHFRPEENDWSLTGQKAAHGTYRVNTGEKVTSPVQLQSDDILKASETWLLVR